MAYTLEKHDKHCMEIAHSVEAHAYGQAWRCPECGEVHNSYSGDFDPDDGKCPWCHKEVEFEQQSLFDWLEDALDIDFTMNSQGQMKGACVCVAWGGPGIYVDTNRCSVDLYWWGEEGHWRINRDACDELDACLEGDFEAAKCS